jgi:hypothetical protein
VGNDRRWPGIARFAASMTVTAAAYVLVFGIGTGTGTAIAVGAGLVVLAVVLAAGSIVGGVVIPRRRAWVAGTARVRSVSPPPAESSHGRLSLEVFVDAPGVPVGLERIRDRAPVTKWPQPGDVLPVLINSDNPRRVRIQWEDVASRPDTDETAPHQEPYPELDAELDADDFTDLPNLDWPPLPRRVLPLEDEPSAGVARYLFPTERFRGEWRRHWVRLGRTHTALLAIAVLGTLAARQYLRPEYVDEVIAALSTVTGLAALDGNLAWFSSRFVLTNKRVMLVEGVLRRRVSSVGLLAIVDLRYEQSPFGRMFNYGAFGVEGVRWLSRMRRIRDLPNPNELYLRIVEELYEPAAVEARLGRADRDYADDYPHDYPHGYSPADESVLGNGYADDDFVDSVRPYSTGARPGPADPVAIGAQALTHAFREAIYGPTLTNYDGWVSVDVLSDNQRVPVSEDRRVDLQPDRRYELRVVIAGDRVTLTAERLVVTGGTDRETAEFAVEVDSDQRALRCPSQRLMVGEDGAMVTFTVQTPQEGFTAPPWLWIRVSQHRRLLQSIELTATGLATSEG